MTRGPSSEAFSQVLRGPARFFYSKSKGGEARRVSRKNRRDACVVRGEWQWEYSRGAIGVGSGSLWQYSSRSGSGVGREWGAEVGGERKWKWSWK